MFEKRDVVSQDFLKKEKIIVLVHLIVFSTIVCAAVTRRFEKSGASCERLSVFVTGEVKESKMIYLPQEATVGDALAQVEVGFQADCEKMAIDAKLSYEQVVIVPKKGVLSVFFKGAVTEERVYYFPLGTTVQEAIKTIACDENASVERLKKSKRRLKDCETVVVKYSSDKKKKKIRSHK